MAIWKWSTGVLAVNGGIAADPSCCCGGSVPCYDTSPNQSTQPDAVISGSDCDCEAGTHNGNYPYFGYDGLSEQWEWRGTSTCDIESGESETLAEVFLFLRCNPESGNWEVSAIMYQLSFQSLHTNGWQAAPGVSVDANDKFQGSVTIDLYDTIFALYQCSVTITWTP